MMSVLNVIKFHKLIQKSFGKRADTHADTMTPRTNDAYEEKKTLKYVCP